MTKKRIRFEVVICCESDRMTQHESAKVIVNQLSSKFGGANSTPCIGGWTDNGNEQRGDYSGIKIEPGFKIFLSVTPEREVEAYRFLRKTISESIRAYNLDVKNVHVEQNEVVARHFDATVECSG